MSFELCIDPGCKAPGLWHQKTDDCGAVPPVRHEVECPGCGTTIRARMSDATPAIDVEHLARQAEWSARTFGPGSRTDGIMDHILKEFREILAEPSGSARRSEEWIDVVILALDGAWRSGLSPDEIIAAVRAKQAKNEARKWPDWRTAEPGKAIEHDRSSEREELQLGEHVIRPGWRDRGDERRATERVFPLTEQPGPYKGAQRG